MRMCGTRLTLCRCVSARSVGERRVSGTVPHLVKGEVDGGEVGSREMGVECPGGVEQRREVRGDVVRHCVIRRRGCQ